jgi:2-polyprenyl-3-methyl-5-hydroxy-6-metoxy-1,4-benzoquinol methylase
VADEPEAPLKSRAEAERAEAHRVYNEAFDLVDRARQKSPEWPEAPPRYDEEKLHNLNVKWDILPDGSVKRPDGLKGPMFDAVWPVLEPILKQQREFNSDLVNHLNRNIEAHRQANHALSVIVPGLREGFNGLCLFEHLTVHFLQTITPFVDTRQREVREAVDELRNVAEVAQRAAAMARREIERLNETGVQVSATTTSALSVASLSSSTTTDAFKYVGFEDRFRGSEDEIRSRLTDYVPYFAGASDVLDVGCGRGEFLDLLKRAGISGRGLDLNPEMVEVCKARGLDATTGDAVGYLTGLPDESLGGLLAIQVVEHLEPGYLQKFLQTAFYKLRPGGIMVLETINPACWVAFFESYIRDLTHVRPIHPETLQYLLHASGFSAANIVYRAPIAEEARLQKVTPSVQRFGEGEKGDRVDELVTAFNRNMDRLNGHLFTFQDYAAVAKRP